MKKLVFLIFIIIPFTVISQRDYYLTFNPNINYAPIGAGFISKNPISGKGYFLQIKLSEDWITRNSSGNFYEYSENKLFDLNEAFFTIGLINNITTTINYYFGIGYLSGTYYQLSSDQISSSDPLWDEVSKKSSFSPVITGGLMYNNDNLLFMFGYDIAFIKPDNYPTMILNKNSVARLTGLVLGIGYNFVSSKK